jgi:hypothetical protein
MQSVCNQPAVGRSIQAMLAPSHQVSGYSHKDTHTCSAYCCTRKAAKPAATDSTAYVPSYAVPAVTAAADTTPACCRLRRITAAGFVPTQMSECALSMLTALAEEVNNMDRGRRKDLVSATSSQWGDIAGLAVGFIPEQLAAGAALVAQQQHEEATGNARGVQGGGRSRRHEPCID